MDQPKIERMLSFITLLAEKRGYTVDEIADRLDMSRRSVYRYIDTFKDARFVFTTSNGHYRLVTDKGTMKELADTIWFTEEEAYVIKRLIDELDNTNSLKNSLQRKLAAISDMTNLGEYTCNKAYAINISKIASAIKGHKQVRLKNYSSAHSNAVSNHIVEPFEFTSNQIDIWAYDTQDGLNKRFKISRIEETEILDNDWSNEQSHKSETIDDFRTHGNDKHHILLELDYLAKNLLIEEYPLAEEHITPIDNDHWRYEADVNKLDGVGRFALGLAEHVKVLNDAALKNHIINSAKKFLSNQ